MIKRALLIELYLSEPFFNFTIDYMIERAIFKH